jgi:hypothetical protein
MHDVLDIIKNVQSLYSVGPTLGILKDFERVVDELDVYVFENWEEGELLSLRDVFVHVASGQDAQPSGWQEIVGQGLQGDLPER